MKALRSKSLDRRTSTIDLQSAIERPLPRVVQVYRGDRIRAHWNSRLMPDTQGQLTQRSWVARFVGIEHRLPHNTRRERSLAWAADWRDDIGTDGNSTRSNRRCRARAALLGLWNVNQC